jgi:hypothetical protein
MEMRAKHKDSLLLKTVELPDSVLVPEVKFFPKTVILSFLTIQSVAFFYG